MLAAVRELPCRRPWGVDRMPRSGMCSAVGSDRATLVPMDPDELALVLLEVQRTLTRVVDRDWSRQAAGLEWNCWQTVDHMIDCIFSYALQVAARAESGFLPFGQLRANSDASNQDLLSGLGAVGGMFLAVVSAAPRALVASDGARSLGLRDWCARAGYELTLHTSDVVSGFDVEWELEGELCRSIVASPQLWMFDRDFATLASRPWTALLAGSGRTDR
jgi:hypothetical protein